MIGPWPCSMVFIERGKKTLSDRQRGNVSSERSTVLSAATRTRSSLANANRPILDLSVGYAVRIEEARSRRAALFRLCAAISCVVLKFDCGRMHV